MFSPKAEAILLVNYPSNAEKYPLVLVRLVTTLSYLGHPGFWLLILLFCFRWRCVRGVGLGAVSIGVRGYINLPRGRCPFLRVSWCFASFAVGG